jgi:HAD superfamily hydrolase (TIGR01509 family)
MPLKGVIFDCDGLLIDTETPDYDSWQEIFEAHGTTLSLPYWQSGIGSAGDFDMYMLLETQSGRQIDRDSIRAARRARHEQMVLAAGVLPGVLPTIQAAQARGLKLAVASSGTARWVQWCLQTFDLLPYFDTVVTADDVQRTKPDPELYLLALERMGLAASEAIALEDSANGAWAAVRAGLYCIAVPNPMTRDLDLSHARQRLNSLEELDLTALYTGWPG